MAPPTISRYRQVSRRAMLKASLGASAAALVPGLACGNADEEIFAGATAEPTTTTTAPPTTTTTAAPTTTAPASQDPDQSATAPTVPIDPAVIGEMVIAFTYTQGAEGKNERPYIAVWIEDAAGDLATTVSLWYELGRRGDRWLDHLTRWFGADEDLVAAGGTSNVATISSATRSPGTYAVTWDGTIDGSPAAAGDYFVCVEAVREEGPYSLMREAVSLQGSLPAFALADNGELSIGSAQINA